MTAAVEVERPAKVSCAVEVFHRIGKRAEIEVVAKVEPAQPVQVPDK